MVVIFPCNKSDRNWTVEEHERAVEQWSLGCEDQAVAKK